MLYVKNYINNKYIFRSFCELCKTRLMHLNEIVFWMIFASNSIEIDIVKSS